MADYLRMGRSELLEEQKLLEERHKNFVNQGLKLDMSRGKPAPEQLDLSMGLLKIDAYSDVDGTDARNYGALQGTNEARELFAGLLGASVDETFVGGNSSLEIMYRMIELGWRVGFNKGEGAWKDCTKLKFICPVPGYDRHFRITEVFGFEMLSVPMLPTGPDMDAVEELVKDEAVKGIWCVPVYSNPDGYIYSDETVRRLANMRCAAKDFRIMWDNAYGFHHLTDEHHGCLNLLNECKKANNQDRALMFCSTSKVTFAGAGVGAAALSAANMARFIEFITPMTIGNDKLNQLRHVRFLTQEGGLDAHMKKHAALIKPKFDAVQAALKTGFENCGDIAKWTEPSGGYFISLFVMQGCAKRTVQLCKDAGVVLTGAGAAYPYGNDPQDSHIRIAPTYPPKAELEQAAELLCIAARMATVEKLLG